MPMKNAAGKIDTAVIAIFPMPGHAAAAEASGAAAYANPLTSTAIAINTRLGGDRRPQSRGG